MSFDMLEKWTLGKEQPAPKEIFHQKLFSEKFLDDHALFFHKQRRYACVMDCTFFLILSASGCFSGEYERDFSLRLEQYRKEAAQVKPDRDAKRQQDGEAVVKEENAIPKLEPGKGATLSSRIHGHWIQIASVGDGKNLRQKYGLDQLHFYIDNW